MVRLPNKDDLLVSKLTTGFGLPAINAGCVDLDATKSGGAGLFGPMTGDGVGLFGVVTIPL